MNRVDGALVVTDGNDDRTFTADELIAAIAGGGGGGRAGARTTMTASYSTETASPTVYYTALLPNGSVLTSRRTSGVGLSAAGDYTYSQDVTALTGAKEFIAVWDEGDASDFVLERIVVDT